MDHSRPTWYVYGLNYDPDIWVDKKQLDGRTAEFVVYRKVFGVKADLGLRDSPKRNWKKLQQHLKIDIEVRDGRMVPPPSLLPNSTHPTLPPPASTYIDACAIIILMTHAY